MDFEQFLKEDGHFCQCGGRCEELITDEDYKILYSITKEPEHRSLDNAGKYRIILTSHIRYMGIHKYWTEVEIEGNASLMIGSYWSDVKNG